MLADPVVGNLHALYTGQFVANHFQHAILHTGITVVSQLGRNRTTEDSLTFTVLPSLLAVIKALCRRKKG
jgi:hypothetical protein